MAMKQDPEEYEVTFEIVTWNTNSSGQEAHFSAIRDILICTVKGPIEHCIIFMQEVKLCGDSVKHQWKFTNCEVAIPPIASGLREAAVVTPPGGKGLEYEVGEKLYDSKLKEKGIKDEFAKRMCGQTVTLKKKIGESEYTSSITMVSYHAHYKKSNKKEKMLEYFEEICKFADTLKQTIIIGGDFNLPVLDWKYEVEDKFKDRVTVALYVGTPRRWNRDRLIDTFAIVQPSDPKYQTKATFKKTMGIYQFPMAGRVGGDQPTALKEYPSSKDQWFKYVHFNDEDLQKVKDALVTKDGGGDGIHLSEPFAKVNPCGPPAPLWPNSCLHQVLDHDPVLTKIMITFKQNDSAQGDTPATPCRETNDSK